MSQIAASHAGGHAHAHHGSHDLSAANINPAAGWGKPLSGLCLAAGAVGIVGVIAGAFTAGPGGVQHAMTSYHVGFIVTLGLVLGPLGFLMMIYLTQAGWPTTFKRQIENIVSMLPLVIVFALPVLVLPAISREQSIWGWMRAAAGGDPVLHEKSAWLNPMFFYIRIVFYFLAWLFLATRLLGLSKRQEATGDKYLTNQARFTSAYGMLLFAITVAFASFDLLKALDYHWFSTMFGVYFFAGNMLAGLCLINLIIIAIQRSGKMKGLITGEHLHDMGKLTLAFTVFWGYITFCQYFLIWYAAVPEETAWYVLRGKGIWLRFGQVLIVGHFVLPFLFLLWRNSKRVPTLLALASAWLLVMHCVDVFYIVRPNLTLSLYNGSSGLRAYFWLDACGVIGPVGIFLGLLIRKISSGPLVGINEPRLHESLIHKNYV